MTHTPLRPFSSLKRAAALTAASTALILLSGCTIAGQNRDDDAADEATVESYRKNASDNLATLTKTLRSYAIVDDESTPGLNAHLFGLPGATSLGQETEKVVLDSFEAAGAFAGRKAFDPVLTDPSQRWEAAAFATPPAASARPTPSTGPTAEGTDTGVDISNRIIAAGGSYLVSSVSQKENAGTGASPAASETSAPSQSPTAKAAGLTRAFVTDLATDTTVDAAKLFAGDVDPAAISADDAGALLKDGEAVRSDDLTTLGKKVAKALHTPLSLPDGADDRDPDFSCALLPCVALTYDDGPGETDVEDRLLSAAKTANVRLTYFLLGKNVKHNPGVVKRMAEAGHEIGNHSFNHPQLSKKSPDAVKKQIEDTNKEIEAAGGGKSTLVRPPYGALTKATAKALGHPSIMWDVDTEDWRSKSSSMVVQSVRTATKPGSIVLMHSIHPSTVDAAPEVFSTVIDKGFYPVTVSDLFAPQKLEKSAEYFCRGYSNALCSNPEHPDVRRN